MSTIIPFYNAGIGWVAAFIEDKIILIRMFGCFRIKHTDL